MRELCSSSTAAELQGAAVAVSVVQPSSEEQLLHTKRAAESLRTASAHCASAEPPRAAVEADPTIVQPSSEEQLLHPKRAAESLRTAIAHCASAEPRRAAVEAAPAESAPSWGSGGQLWERPGCAAEPSWGRAAFAPIRPALPNLPKGGRPGKWHWCWLEENKTSRQAKLACRDGASAAERKTAAVADARIFIAPK